MNGTFWPTMISASWLSSVNRLGVESRLLWVLLASAEINAPKRSLPSCRIAPSGADFFSSNVSPPTIGMSVPGKLMKPLASPVLRFHCTPTASAISPEISTMAAWISTWARGWSN
ncbi:hypothetical protein D3C85_1424040 [compost metagenome]